MTSPLGLPIAWYWEYIVLTIIGLISFKIGWAVSPGGKWGSIIHWTVRLLAFVGLWAVTRGVIVAAKWMMVHYILCLSICATIVVCLIGISIFKFTKNKNLKTI